MNIAVTATKNKRDNYNPTIVDSATGKKYVDSYSEFASRKTAIKYAQIWRNESYDLGYIAI